MENDEVIFEDSDELNRRAVIVLRNLADQIESGRCRNIHMSRKTFINNVSKADHPDAIFEVSEHRILFMTWSEDSKAPMSK